MPVSCRDGALQPPPTAATGWSTRLPAGEFGRIGTRRAATRVGPWFWSLRDLDGQLSLSDSERGEKGDEEMQAKRGDRILVEGTVVGQPRREGEVVEVIGIDDRTHYRVRWQDGHESVFYPGPDAHLVPSEE